ncbi:hypothetical protein SAMN04488502_1017 [Dendrosporobacter quercicolus]|uniref:MJ0042 family finger-like domain-containing protein n=1 Tax=Dendrosporobacter quercicolus TaxID=146817 RepID=A0A1G9KEA8_9FIRM|nr:hypothetical protein SAMN04488502_1017 [Dendrosporobacter quercicolus]
MLAKGDVRSQCQIQKHIKVICPFCEKIFEIPMHKAVNGETLECAACKRHFVFRKERLV